MASIELDDVSLHFRVRQKRRVTLKEYLLHRLYRRSVNPVMEVRALHHITLSLKDGDRIGIIGHNGAGKSTLLRLLAGIYPPTSGRIHIEGQVSSLFDLTLGFEMESTGWENINYRAFLQGETPKSIAAKRHDIAEFCELGDFLHMPVRFYSAGMLVRLAFAIATAFQPEILLIDEVLGVGDLSFQQKAKARLHQWINQARLLVVVSHDTDSLVELCTTGIWMERGAIQQIGPMRSVAAAYTRSVLEPARAA
jgi:ABC-type polysaccharide/polyol phosphate transport system ATPase subunit